MNILTSLRRVAQRQPTALALRHGERELSYESLLDQAARLARFLRDNGVGPGQRVGILMHNQPEWVISLLAIWQIGAVVVPYNYLIHPAALRHSTVDADVQWIVTPADDLERLEEALAGLDVLSRVITVGASDDHREFADVVASNEPLARVVPRLDHDDAIIMYTSGSTGMPKGVRQTHRNIGAVCDAARDIWSLTEADHALVCTPLFHVGGLPLITLPTLFAGGTVTLRRWKVREFLDDVVQLKATFLALVPAMMVDILNELGDSNFPLPSVRVCAIGGSALPLSKLKALTRSTGIVAVNIYGQTEQNGVSITEPLDEERREGSLGKPIEQIVQIRVVDPSDEPARDVGPGEFGELWVRGDAVSPGYWNLPEATANKFTPDGWFRTSDLVRIAEDGYVYYVDRADEMIISGGENVFPQMVEGFLAACPLVAEVVVIGTPHERLSSQVTAIIVPTTPDVTAEDIAAYCESEPNLRGLQRPRRIEIVESLPRTATNKFDRPRLKKSFV